MCVDDAHGGRAEGQQHHLRLAFWIAAGPAKGDVGGSDDREPGERGHTPGAAAWLCRPNPAPSGIIESITQYGLIMLIAEFLGYQGGRARSAGWPGLLLQSDDVGIKRCARTDCVESCA